MSLRDAIVDHARWGAANEKQIHYTQAAGRMDAVHTPRHLPLHTDCSGFVTFCYSWAGAPDPNGRGYNGTGYTGTLLDHLEHISRADLQPADLVVFGPYPGDHVVIVVDDAVDPMTVSHGQEKGPILIRLSREDAAHRKPTFYLRGQGLDAEATAPPPEEDDMRPEQAIFYPPADHKDAGTYVLGAHGFTDAVRVIDPAHLTYWKGVLKADPLELDGPMWDQLNIVEPQGHKGQ